MKPIDVIQLTQELIRCASITPADEGAQEVLKKPLRDMGFEIFDLPFEGNGGSYPVKNFFARLGTGAPHLCYAGHTDVVPVGDEASWKYPPFNATIDGDIMYGRGTSDMKGGNTAFVTAISRFLNDNPDFNGSISLLITGDEEAESINGTKRVLKWMEENNHTPTLCIVGEPTNTNVIGDTVKIGRRGYITGEITVNGRSGHVAYSHLALNPITHLAKIIEAMNDIVFDEGNAHFDPSNLQFSNINAGEGALNVIPNTATASVAVRFNDTHTTITIKEILQKTIDTLTNDTDYDVDFVTREGGDSFLTQAGPMINQFVTAIHDVTGHTAKLSTSGGTSDARYIKNYCPVFEFGLKNKTIHQTDECLSVTDLETLTQIYTKFLQEHFKQS